MNPGITPISRRRALHVAGLSSLAFAVPQRSVAQTPAAPEVLQVGGATAEDLTPLYYGIKTGMFSKAGLDVSIVTTNSGSAATAAVVAGTYNIAKTSLLGVFNAHLRGIPIVIIAPEVVYTARDREALLEQAMDSSFKGGASLTGKTLAVPSLSDLNTLASMAWVDQNGGDSKTLKFVEIPNSAMPAALAEHRVDVAIIEPPVLDAALKAGTIKTIADPMGSIGSTYMIAAYIARADWVAAHPSTVRRFTRTLYAAANYVNSHHAQTAAHVAELTKIDLSIAQKMNRTMGGTRLDEALVQPIIDTAARYGTISRSFPARELLWDEGAR
jgi:NitT/TauT family transport system substrate-binding protein